tara:strand:- start:1534 stop:2793 length:1260 start_codon:yes stop_codon:yes gene_type:complete
MEIIQKWAYQINSRGERKLVHVDNVDNGIACNCICTKCFSKLKAIANVEGVSYKKVSHFAHVNETSCKGETLAHIEAKNIIEKEGYLWLPRYIGKGNYDTTKVHFDEVLVEEKINNSNYSADLWCIYEEKSIAVEIVVTHDLDEQKRKFLVENKIDTLSIYIGSSLQKEQYNDLPKDFTNLVLKKSTREWDINEEIDIAFEKEIENLREREEKEHAEWLKNGGREHLENQKIEEQKRDSKLRVLEKELKRIKKRDHRNYLYGILVRADLRKYGGWKNALCVKSNILSAQYDNLAFVADGYEKYKDCINEKVGFKMRYYTEYWDDKILPHCKVVWCKKINEKQKKIQEEDFLYEEKSIDDRLNDFLKVNDPRIKELSNFPGYSYLGVKSLISERFRLYKNEIQVLAYLNNLIQDAQKQND